MPLTHYSDWRLASHRGPLLRCGGVVLLAFLLNLVYDWPAFLLALWLGWWLWPWQPSGGWLRDDRFLVGTTALVTLPMVLVNTWWGLGLPLRLGWWLWVGQRGALWERAGRWLFATPLLLTTLLYLTIVLLPFYGNGIYLYSDWDIGRSYVDVKHYPPFNWWGQYGGPLLEIALTTHFNFPLQLAVLTPLLLKATRTEWQTLHRLVRLGWVVTALGCALVFVLTLPEWPRIMVWLVD